MEELKECKEKLNSYEIEITDLKDLVKELDNMKAKIDEYKNPSEELLELRNKVDNTTRWCNNIEGIFDQLFLFAEHISENWNLNQQGDEDIGRTIHQLSLCARNAMFMLQPRMATFVDYQQPAWLTEKIALKSLQNAKN